MKREVITALVILLFISGACRKTTPEFIQLKNISPVREESTLELLRVKGFAEKNIGYVLYNLNDKKVIDSHNMDKSFVPASTLKLVTIALALDTLGSDYRFVTELGYRGKVKDGTLQGDLFIKGGGDPMLGVDELLAMIKKLNKLGIRQVDGSLVYDESALAHLPFIDNRMYFETPYNPGISALSFNYNTVRGHWEPDPKREKISSMYLLPDLPMHDFFVAGKKGDARYEYIFEQKGGREVWYLALPAYTSKNQSRNKKIIRNRKMRLWEGVKTFPVKDPGRFSAEAFIKLCGIQGIAVKNKVPLKSTLEAEGEKGKAFEIVYSHESRPMWEIARTTLRWSSNVMAELLFLAAVKKLSGKKTDLTDAASEEKKFLKNKFSSPDWGTCNLVNGSGLSYGNLVSPLQMLSALAWAHGFRSGENNFEELLPIIGWDAAYGERLADPENAFRVRAKTGSMFYAISLAGYVTVESNKKMLFAILTSDSDRIKSFLKLGDYAQKQERETARGYAWNKGAREAIDLVLRHWIKKY